jgi:GntR family transcriptional regulator, transcriptional repressor for pyruvate dehydrogenase complex
MSEPKRQFAPVERNHAADDVFEQLAGAILDGTMPVGSTLPPERVLAERFAVSRIIARQAVHRLAEIGLVRVRQGGGTTILNWQSSADLRVLELTYQLGPTTPADVYDFTERQIMQAHAILYIAQRKGTAADWEIVHGIVEDYAARGGTDEELPAFELAFWRALATTAGNRLYLFEMNWWARVLATNPRALHPVLAPPHTRIGAFREMVRRLKAGEDAAALFLDVSTLMLNAFHASQSEKPTPRRRRDDR